MDKVILVIYNQLTETVIYFLDFLFLLPKITGYVAVINLSIVYSQQLQLEQGKTSDFSVLEL